MQRRTQQPQFVLRWQEIAGEPRPEQLGDRNTEFGNARKARFEGLRSFAINIPPRPLSL